MKKYLIMLGLILGLFVYTSNFCFANNSEKLKLISEIGTLSNQEKYDEALEKCSLAMKTYPNEAILYYWSATIKSLKGDRKNALIDYNKVIELNPNADDAYVMRGICKSDLNDIEGAIKDYNTAIKLNPQNSSAYSMRACAKIDLGDFNGANDDLNIANKIVDDFEHINNSNLEKNVNSDTKDSSIPNLPALEDEIKAIGH